MPPHRTGFLRLQSLLRGRYRIVRRLGRGGMGAVYYAEDTDLGNRAVAVKEMGQSKVPPRELPRAIKAFRREALLLAKLNHPHIPRIYEHFSEGGRHYLVMDFIEGETLDRYLYETMHGRIPVEEALDIGMQLCDVLSYLHTQRPQIIFRDLKPLNVMRTAHAHLYLIDFGIARHFKTGKVFDTTQFGTPGYLAPESNSQQSSPRTDIYSLGAMLHQLLTGYNPASTPFHFPPLRHYDASIPTELEALIFRMVDWEPANRPASMREVREELRAIHTMLLAADARSSHLIESMRGRRALPPVEIEPAVAYESQLYVEVGENAGIVYELMGEEITIGRNPQCDIHLDERSVSRMHATLVGLGNGLYGLRDEESVNGTLLNGQLLPPFQLYPLTNGDRIQVGHTILIFRKL